MFVESYFTKIFVGCGFVGVENYYCCNRKIRLQDATFFRVQNIFYILIKHARNCLLSYKNGEML